MKKPKILLYDIETMANLAWVWGKYEQNVIAFAKEWDVLCFAYKWVGDKDVTWVKRRGRSDKALMKELKKLFDEADIIIAHNGDKFDNRKVAARMVFHDLKPPKFARTVDTRKVAKKYFSFNGNSLDELAVYLGIGAKMKNPGFDMWLGCDKGDPKSWKQMGEYNKHDVVLLEKVYERFLPWIQNHPNMSMLRHGHRTGCSTCGSTRIHYRGSYPTSTTLMRRTQCQDCGHWDKFPMKKVSRR